MTTPHHLPLKDKMELPFVDSPTAEWTPINIDELTTAIYRWGSARQILQNSSALSQSRKTGEEYHELVEAAVKFDTYKCVKNTSPVLYEKTRNSLKDAIGDVYVTLCMVAGCAGFDIRDCIEHAYHEIKDRKGHLNEDGVFVKEES